MIDVNPAKQGIDNPQRRRTEKRPFESWDEMNALATGLGPRFGLMLFAAATGQRPGEWMALEHRDIDPDRRVLYVRRAWRNGRLKSPKTEASIRAVPLQAIALAALEALPTRPGHLARVHAIQLLDLFTGAAANVHEVDAAWTFHQRVVAHRENATTA